MKMAKNKDKKNTRYCLRYEVMRVRGELCLCASELVKVSEKPYKKELRKEKR